MESNFSEYIVSARKYRPQTFDSMVGQEHVTNTLKNAILNNKIAQAYLFFGPRGVGKTTCARVFAKTINCMQLREDGEACNVCDSCKAFHSSTSFNIYELDAASNNSVEDIRQLIDQVRYPPQIAKYKVYIIDEVHMLSAAAFNAFLKTLEEPPPYAKFILATTEKNKVLPTILSRCQVFNFNRIKTEDIAKYLERIASKEGHQFEHEAIRVIAQKADGGLRDACSIYDQMVAFTQGNITAHAVIENLHVLDYDYYFQMTEAFLNRDYRSVLLLLDDILSKGFDAQNVLIGLMDHLRYLLLARDPQTLIVLDLSDNARVAVIQQSKKCSDEFLLNALSILNKADVNLRLSRHQRLHLEIHLLQLANIEQKMGGNEKKNIAYSDTDKLENGNSKDLIMNERAHGVKVIKVSDQPVTYIASVEQTFSIKKVRDPLQENGNSGKAAIGNGENKKDISIEKKENVSIQDEGDAIGAKVFDKMEDAKKEAEQIEKQRGNKVVDEGNNHEHDELSKNEIKNETHKNEDGTMSITEKRYKLLLLQNVLLEEMKVKLHLEFK